MKKGIISILSAIIVLLGGGYTAVQLGGGFGGDNNFPEATHAVATTTANTLPIQLLTEDYGRRYVRIANVSDTVGYIFLTDVSASTTIDTLDEGIKLAAGASYEIFPSNLYTGYIYGTSTLSNKAFSILESKR